MPAPPSSTVKAQNAANIAGSKGNVGPTSGLGSNYGGSGSNSGYTNTNASTSTTRTGGGSVSTSGTGGKNNSTGGYNTTGNYGGSNNSPQSNMGGQKASNNTVGSQKASSTPKSPMAGQGTSYNSQNAGRGTMAGAPPSAGAPQGQTYHSVSGPGTPRGPTPVNAGSTRLGTGGLNAAVAPITQPRDTLGSMPRGLSPESYGWASTGPSRLSAHVANQVAPESLVRQAASFSQDEVDTLLASKTMNDPALQSRLMALDPQKRTATAALVAAADRYGVPRNTALGMGSIESGLGSIPNRPGSQYQGLTQMGQWEFGAYGSPDSLAIGRNDPWASAQSGLNYMADNNQRFRNEFGREPTLGDTYGMHQQGYSGYTSLRANPNKLAKDVIGSEKVLANGGNLKMTAEEFANHIGNQPVRAMARHIPEGGDVTRVTAQPQTPSGVSPIPSPTGRLGPSQNMNLPPPSGIPDPRRSMGGLPPPQDYRDPVRNNDHLFSNPFGPNPARPAGMFPVNPGMGADPYAGRTAPPQSVQAGPVAPAQTAEQRMGISLPPSLPPPNSMPGVLNPQTRQYEYAQYDPLSSVSVPPQQVASAPPMKDQSRITPGVANLEAYQSPWGPESVAMANRVPGPTPVTGPLPAPSGQPYADFRSPPIERVTAVDPYNVDPFGERVRPLGPVPDNRRKGTPQQTAFNDTGRKLNVPGGTADTISPEADPAEEPYVREPYDPNFEGVQLTPKIAQKHKRMNTMGEVGKVLVDVGLAPGLGDVLGRPLGRWVGSLGPDETSKIASSTRLAELSARNINEKASKAGYQGRAVTTNGLQQALKNPKKVLNGSNKEYTPIEKLIAKIEDSKNGKSTSNSADMDYLKKLSMGYQPFDNTYVSSY